MLAAVHAGGEDAGRSPSGSCMVSRGKEIADMGMEA